MLSNTPSGRRCYDALLLECLNYSHGRLYARRVPGFAANYAVAEGRAANELVQFRSECCLSGLQVSRKLEHAVCRREQVPPVKVQLFRETLRGLFEPLG